MSGMGGYGATLIYDAAKHETRFLDASRRIPASLNADVFRAPTPNYLQNSQRTYQETDFSIIRKKSFGVTICNARKHF